MKFKRLFILTLLLSIATISFAQEKKKVFLDENFKMVKKANKASYYEIRAGKGTRKSFIGKVSLYTLEDKLVHYEFLFKGKRDGTFVSFDQKNGAKTIGKFKKGKRTGTWYRTDFQGNIISSFEYNKEGETENEVDLQTNNNTYYALTDLPPEYAEGGAAWNLHLRKSIRYPAKIGVAGFQGTIVINFLIDREGNIIDHFSQDCPHPVLLENIKTVFDKSGDWRGAIKDGKAVNSIFIFRSSYNLIGVGN